MDNQEEFRVECPDDCEGCSCHLCAPCTHCVYHVHLIEDEEDEYQPNAGQGGF